MLSPPPHASPNRVDVLMSTYNGARFLGQQVESILSQTWTDLRLVVRDDGSTDGTVPLLEEMAAGSDRITLTKGENLGSTASFFRLLEQVPADTRHAAFSDQDDVWLPDKIARAVLALAEGPSEEPRLYCSRVTLTDDRLNRTGATPAWPRTPGFGNALVENIAMGCTIVLNRAAIDLLQSVPAPRHAIQHDWWCYLVVAAFGRVIFDLRPGMAYRQHGANSIGIRASAARRLVEKIGRQFRQDSFGLIVAQAEDFRARYGGRLGPTSAAQLVRMTGATSLRRRLAAARDPAIYRQHCLDDLLLRLRLLAGPARRTR